MTTNKLYLIADWQARVNAAQERLAAARRALRESMNSRFDVDHREAQAEVRRRVTALNQVLASFPHKEGRGNEIF